MAYGGGAGGASSASGASGGATCAAQTSSRDDMDASLDCRSEERAGEL